ncbi:MAG: flavodoxin domain-containing protein [Verrucomicrobia bacterium]|nr:flavodoxin domain-containing protein [Verrucomicrobiota bacterium]MBU4291672.1 flavodoxin domain-containing protein [Verrucomicrobiota bacterium]MBU4429307.1 flavodoxin domain-containing protein [Verrucomicrobiota bacterium]MCG2680402.1 flavodoxin domain-containing protein [Kiritimatiellia bacterium]
MKVAIIYHSETGNTQKMAELVAQGCRTVTGVEARAMSIDDVDNDYISEAKAIIFGSPTYEGSCSWQMKRYLDTGPKGLAGKLAGVFASQNWPGGGGASFAEMTMIAALLVHGMLVYSGGISVGTPYLHFGAVSRKAPEEDLYKERCIKLGNNIAKKALELFPKDQ